MYGSAWMSTRETHKTANAMKQRILELNKRGKQ